MTGAQATATTTPENRTASDVGVTADGIRLGQLATLSGPVPGLFLGTVAGVQAAIAYQNSVGGVNGRTFALDTRDDALDASTARSQTQDAAQKDFAFVGSITLNDDVYIKTLGPTVPDVGPAITDVRGAAPNNFSVSPSGNGSAIGPFVWVKDRHADAVTAVASLYADLPAAKVAQQHNQRAAESVGWKWVYTRAYQATETDFTADIIRMRQAGVKLVYLVTDAKSIARITKAAAQQNFKPLFVTVVAGYDPAVVQLAGDAANGEVIAMQNTMFLGEDSGEIPEVALMIRWLHKVKPNFTVDLFAAEGWAHARLFFKALQTAGTNPTRGSVIQELRKVTSWNSYGMFAEAGPGTKRPPICYVLATLVDGKFRRLDPAAGFRCTPGGYYTAP